jgi:hypothetical protein
MAMRNLGALLALFVATGCAATLGGGDETPPPSGNGSGCDPAADTCPTGQWCGANGQCVPGCAVDADCGNGGACCDHTCVDTSSDPSSCGSCGHACGTGEGCCDSQCTELNTLADCGSCGNVCMDGNFCDGTTCLQPTYPNFCANSKVYVIHDGISADNSSADAMASTITANCAPTTTVTTADQTDATLVDQTTGRPLAGAGVTYVLGGGPFPNKVLRYLESNYKATPIYFDAPDGVNFYWRSRATGSAVAQMPGSACSTTHDQFLVELVTDPMSGTLSLIGYGACSGKGTKAAAYFYANVILPAAVSYPDSWYVFSWTDGNGNATPDNGDSFTTLAHGK